MIVRLIRYPVKSMRGEDLRMARLTRHGIIGDRGWALIDTESGRIVSAKHPRKWAGMLGLAAKTCEDTGSVAITFPDGRVISSKDSTIDDRLSEHLGRTVHLSSRQPSEGAIERADPIVAGAFVEENVRETRESRLGGLGHGHFFDYAPLHVVTVQTLDALQQFSPQSRFDVARFRPNLLLDLPEVSPFAENGWRGARMFVGRDVVLELDLPTPRCAIPTVGQPGLPYDPGVIRTIARHNRITVEGTPSACLGAYARVLRGGDFRIGDEIRLERGE